MEITNSTTFKELFVQKKISRKLNNCMKYRNLKTILDAKVFFENNDSPLLGDIEKELYFLFSTVSSENEGDNIVIYDMLKGSLTLKNMNSAGYISNRLYNCLNNQNFKTFQDVIKYAIYVKDIREFSKIKGFGKACISELELLLLRSDEYINSKNARNEITNTNTLTLNNTNNCCTELTNDFYKKYDVIRYNTLYQQEINFYYNNLKINASGRVRDFLDKYAYTVDDALNLFFNNGVNLCKNHRCGKKSIDEINGIIFSLYNYICGLFTTDIDSHIKNICKREYPFLSNNDVEFVLSFHKINLCFPMFFILYKYLITSNARFERIFCEYNGIDCERATLRTIARKYRLSAETVRKSLSIKDVENSKLITSNEWDRYEFLKKIIFEKNTDFEKISYNENLHLMSFSVFMSLCSLIKRIEIFDVKDKKYYVSEQLLDCFDLKNSIRDIKNTLAQKRTENIVLPVSIFIDTYVTQKPRFDAIIIQDLIKSILVKGFGLNLVGNSIIIKKNCLDRKKEIYRIIEENKAPMHINDIRLKLMSKYSEFADVSIENIRSDIQRHPNIKPIGKKSTYSIDKWNVYTGTIIELIYNILGNSDNPIGIKDLYDIIVLKFPSTSEKSITTLLFKDDRFVRYEGWLYGLYGKQYPSEYKICTNIRHNLSFEERCDEYENFIITHHHSPQSNGTEEEKSLLRWYNNIISGRISTTESQSIRFNNMIKKYDDFIMSGEEYSYYRFVKDFKLFLEENYRFPSENDKEEKILFMWFYRQQNRYKSYQDKRKKFFGELLMILEEYGFVFE